MQSEGSGSESLERRVLIASGVVIVGAVIVLLLVWLLVLRNRGADTEGPQTKETVSTSTSTTVAPSPRLQSTGVLLGEVDGHGALFSGTAIGLTADFVEVRGARAPEVAGVLAIADGLAVDSSAALTGLLELRLPLPERPAEDAVPVVVRVGDDGAPLYEAGLYDPGSNEIIVGTSSFSDGFGAWLSPQQWWDALAAVGSSSGDGVGGSTHFVTNFLGGWTNESKCEDPGPAWASNSMGELQSIHVCLRSGTAGDGADEVEIVLTSLRRTAQLVQLPVAHDHVRMAHQPDVLNDLLVAAAGGEEGSVLLTGGEEVSVGFRQPTTDLSYDVRIHQNRLVDAINQVGAILGGVTHEEMMSATLAVLTCANSTADNGNDDLVGCAIRVVSDEDRAVTVFDAALAAGGIETAERDEFVGSLRAGLARLEPIAAVLFGTLDSATTTTSVSWQDVWPDTPDNMLKLLFTGTDSEIAEPAVTTTLAPTTTTTPAVTSTVPPATTAPPTSSAPRCPQFANGLWVGSWDGGGLRANLRLVGGTISGDLMITGSYLSGGQVEGYVDCDVVHFGKVDRSVEFEGVLSADGRAFNGTFKAWPSPGGSPDTGSFSIYNRG